jgi:ParB family chromosome partitioning protein
LEDAGFQRSVIQTALSVDRAEVSKLVSVARAIPSDVVEAIGRAPKVGRGRWQALAEAIGDQAAPNHVQFAIRDAKFVLLNSDARFSAVLSAANQSSAVATDSVRSISSAAGAEIARVKSTETQIRLTMSRDGKEGFAAFLVEKLPELFETYARTLRPDDRSED